MWFSRCDRAAERFGALRAEFPTASVNSLSLVRTALSTSTTIDLERSSSASMGTDASALGSAGSTRLAAANSASRRLRRRRRLHSHSSTTSSTSPAAPMSSARHGTVSWVLSPLAAATAAPTQSPLFSLGSIWLRRTSSASVEVPPDTVLGTWKAKARASVAMASTASSSPKSLNFMVVVVQVSAPWPAKSLT